MAKAFKRKCFHQIYHSIMRFRWIFFFVCHLCQQISIIIFAMFHLQKMDEFNGKIQFFSFWNVQRRRDNDLPLKNQFFFGYYVFSMLFAQKKNVSKSTDIARIGIIFRLKWQKKITKLNLSFDYNEWRVKKRGKIEWKPNPISEQQLTKQIFE